MNRIILFDLGGVLFHWNDQWLFDEIFKQTKIRFEKIRDGFNLNINNLFEAKISEKQFWEKILGKNKINSEIISQTFSKKAKLNNNIMNMAKILKNKGCETGILSNITTEARKSIDRELISNFDHVFFSDVIKMSKPNSKVFSHVTKKLSSKEIIFIDDKLENIREAKKHGIHSILFKEYGSLKREITKHTSIAL